MINELVVEVHRYFFATLRPSLSFMFVYSRHISSVVKLIDITHTIGHDSHKFFFHTVNKQQIFHFIVTKITHLVFR